MKILAVLVLALSLACCTEEKSSSATTVTPTLPKYYRITAMSYGQVVKTWRNCRSGVMFYRLETVFYDSLGRLVKTSPNVEVIAEEE